jgi:hypothetical protein
MYFPRLFFICIFFLLLGGCREADKITGNATKNSSLDEKWYNKIPAIARVTLKKHTKFREISIDSAKLEEQLSMLHAQGFRALEIFATPDGGNSYGGLDAQNRYEIDPEVGTMDDFRRVVRQVHRKGMYIIAFDNLGYSAIDAPHFLKACDDMRNGVESKEARWFWWSKTNDAAPPQEPDRYYLGGSRRWEKWVWSERAQHYYWSKWPGVDSTGKKCDLPQYYWSNEWQEEVKNIVHFWMKTGIDGFVVDAVNWYVGYNWQMGKECITDIVHSYGDKFIQPEGAGGFHEDPVAWITEGGWNCVQDYGLGIWWEEDTRVLEKAINNADPGNIERALRDYHDRVVTAGGVLYGGADSKFDSPAKKMFYTACNVSFGNLHCYSFTDDDSLTVNDDIAWLLSLKEQHPALQQLSTRRKIETNDDSKFYSFLRTDSRQTQRMLVVLNFQPEQQEIEVDLSGVSFKFLTDAKTNEKIEHASAAKITCDGMGYRFFIVED